MRRISVFDRLSADGCFAGTDGNLDWVVPDEEIDRAGAQGAPHLDTILFGRRTYELFASFWPHALDESATVADPHRPGRRSPEMHTFAIALNNADKWVFSRTLNDVTWANSRLVHNLDARAIDTLKRQPGNDIMVFGSGSITSQLTDHHLVDEYQLVLSPVFLGSGRRLLGDLSQPAKLELLEAKSFPSGNVILRYARTT